MISSCSFNNKKSSSIHTNNSFANKNNILYPKSQYNCNNYKSFSHKSRHIQFKSQKTNNFDKINKSNQQSCQNYDENSSYLANRSYIIDEQKKYINIYETNKNIFINQENIKVSDSNKVQNQQISQNKNRKVIDLKKKIKKTVNNESFFRTKIKFIKKSQQCIKKSSIQKTFSQDNHAQSPQRPQKIVSIEQYEQFTIYQDRQIFSTSSSTINNSYKQLIDNLIPQRLDNDMQTDQEQMQKVVRKVSKQFIQNIKKYIDENKEKKQMYSCQYQFQSQQ